MAPHRINPLRLVVIVLALHALFAFPAYCQHSGVQPASARLASTQNFSVRSLGAPQENFVFNYSDAPWELVIRRFAENTGLSLRMEAKPPGKFSFHDQRPYSAIEAIDILNGELLRQNFVLVRGAGTLRLVELSDGIPPHLAPSIPLSELSQFGQFELCSTVIPLARLDGPQVTKDIQNLLSPFGSAVCLTYTNNIMVTDIVTNIRRIRDFLMAGDAPSRFPSSQIVRLKNAPAETVVIALKEFVAQQAQAGAEAATSIPPDKVTVVAEPSTNSILVTAPEPYLCTIADMIVQLDSAVQVVIQALLVEVELDNLDEFGVELGGQDPVLFDRSVLGELVTLTETVADPSTGILTTSDRVISQSGSPGFAFNNSPLGNNVAIRPNVLGPQGLTNFGVGRVNGDLGYGGLVLSAGSESVNILLRALSSRRQVDILSRPQIRTLENHEAEIQIGSQVPVVDGVAVSAVGSANPVIRQDQAGIILKVKPRVKDNQMVVMDVSAERSAFQPGAGVPIFTDATSGNVIQAPVKNLTQANTRVSVMNGETIVLGGMITKDIIEVNRKVPYLGDIPFLGRIFRHDLSQTKRRELLIFLTPKIIFSAEDSQRITGEETARIHMRHDVAQQMHGPFDPGFLPENNQAQDSTAEEIPPPTIVPDSNGPAGLEIPGASRAVPEETLPLRSSTSEEVSSPAPVRSASRERFAPTSLDTLNLNWR